MSSLLIHEHAVSPSWHSFLKEWEPQLLDISSRISSDSFAPDPDKVLRFSEIPLSNIRVVILGQDPYPQPGVATGRSFEVGGLESWDKPFPQASLRNILRAIYLAYTDECLPWRAVREQILSGAFPLPPPGRWFDALAAQGVLFLNASLTCPIGRPGGHRSLWLPFSRALISYISKAQPGACWFLWGKDAQSFLPLLTGGKIYLSNHPMMCGTQHPKDFLKSPCFRDTSDRIDWRCLSAL